MAKRRDLALKGPQWGAEAGQLAILNADSGAAYRLDGCKTVDRGGAFIEAGAAKAVVSAFFNVFSAFDSLQRAADCGF